MSATRREWFPLESQLVGLEQPRTKHAIHVREVLPGDEEKILVSLQELTDWAWANFAKEDCGYIARMAERLFDEFNEKGPIRPEGQRDES